MANKKIPIKTTRIQLDGDYEGWWFDIRTNPPVGLLLDKIEQFDQADKTNIKEFISSIYELMDLMLTNWNFKNEQGKELPASVEGMKGISLDLLMLMSEKVPDILVEATEVPKASSGRSKEQ